MPRTIFILIPLILAALSAQAQQKKRASAPPPPVRAGFPLESVRVEGNHEIAAENIIAASGLKHGQVVQKADFDAARNRLLATGAFTGVGYEYKPSADNSGYDAVLQVTEAAPFFAYRFEDLPASADVLRAALRKAEPLFGDRIPGSEAVIDRYAKAIQQALGNNHQVTGKIEEDSPDDVVVVFRPPTAPPNVAQVRFVGNDALPSTTLLSRMSEVATGIPYTEINIRKRLDAAIRPLYEARGRIRVSFPKIEAAKADNVNGVVVTITVNEGASYNLGTVSFTGVPSGEAVQLQKLVDLKKGDIANFDDVNAGLDKVYKHFRNNGYIHMTSKVDRNIHDEDHIVNLTVAIDTGPQYHFGKLEINGLDIIGEPAVRKMWGAMEGKPFQPDYPEAFLARVRDEGIFDNLGKTRSETRINDASKTVDVALFFSGAGPQPDNRKQQPAQNPGAPPDIQFPYFDPR